MNFTDDSKRAASHSSAGKYAVLGMIAVAVVAATFAWWWNFNRGRKTLAFFGPQTARLIRTAPKVEILVIGGPESGVSTDDRVTLNNFTYSIYKRIDISKAPGLIHARASLLADSSYLAEAGKTQWQSHTAIVRFANGDAEAYLAITEPDGRLVDLLQGKSIPLIQITADGWRQFIERNVKQAEAGAAAEAATPPGPARTDPSE